VSAYLRLFGAAEHDRGNPGRAHTAYLRAVAWLDAPSKEEPTRTNFARLSWEVRFDLDVLRREIEGKLALPREPGTLAPVLDPLPSGPTMKDQKPGEQWRVSVGGAHLYFEARPDRRLILSGATEHGPTRLPPPPASSST
jgi:hypothetical protein